MRKVAALAAVVTMSAGALTACSGGDYCSEMQNYAEAAKHLDVKDSKAVDTMRNEVKKVSKSAPDDLKDDWKVVLDYADKTKAANGDQAKLTQLANDDSGKMSTALAAITLQARDTCNVSLSQS
jgi:hypothetical protein